MIAKAMKAGDTGVVLLGESNPFVRGPAAAPAKPVLLKGRARTALVPRNKFLALYTSPYIREVEPTIYLTEAWLSAAVCMNSCLMEMFEDLCSVKPELGAPFELSGRLFAQWVAQNAKLLGLWIPKAPSKPAPIVTEFVEMGEEALKEAIEVEEETMCRCMDIVTGAGSEWERRCAPRARPRRAAS
jgi:hypothetical protein